jgi:NADPH-dependent curcumin reductase CurA
MRRDGSDRPQGATPDRQPSDGQVLVRNLWLSVDPAQRMYVRIAFVKNRAHPAEIPAYSVSFRLARL